MTMTTPQQTHLKGQYAGFFSRVLALAIDAAIITGISFLLLVITQAIFNLFGLECLLDLEANSCEKVGAVAWIRPILLLAETLAPVITIGFSPLFTISYLVFFWTLTGQTPGKSRMGLRVVRVDGGAINWHQSVRRLIGYGLSILSFMLGFLWILVDDQRRGLHDKVAGTCVIYAWNARPDETFLVETLQALNQESHDP